MRDLIWPMFLSSYLLGYLKYLFIDGMPIVKAWNTNCPQHITPRYTLAELEPHVGTLRERIKELEVKLDNCCPKK